MNEDYDDLIDYDYRGSQKRRHMSMNDRAAQFAPFSALEGYEEAVKESEMENLEQYLDQQYEQNPHKHDEL